MIFSRVTHRLAVATIAAATLLSASAAHAAGSIVIEQDSGIQRYGEWTLSTPSGSVKGATNDRTKTVANAARGQYQLSVEPPDGAQTKITFTKGEEVLQVVDDTQYGFLFSGSGTLRAMIEYSYGGVIDIETQPSGASYELSSPQVQRKTGTSPTRLTELPPAQYTITFTPPPGCDNVKPQNRVLKPQETLKVSIQFKCGTTAGSTTSKAAARSVGITTRASSSSMMSVAETFSEPSENQNFSAESTISFGFTEPNGNFVEPSDTTAVTDADDLAGRVAIAQTVRQSETVAGGTVDLTITVRNTGRRTLRDLRVVDRAIDADITLPPSLPEGGTVQGTEATWMIAELQAGQSWNVTFPVQLPSAMKQGMQATMIAEVSHPALLAMPVEDRTATAEIGVAQLPPTGARADLLFLAVTAALTLLPVLGRKRFVALRAF